MLKRLYRISLCSLLLVCAFALLFKQAHAQVIESAEYFFDTDPGIGNATPLAIPSGDQVTHSASISIASLSPGFHLLGIRVMESGGLWSQFELRGFYITSSVNDVSNILAAEYFFNEDPGVGNGNNIAVTPGESIVINIDISTTGLLPGFNFLVVRTLDADNRWGIFESRGFYITTATDDAADITAAEYFFDADPGVGNGTAIPVTEGATVNATISLPSTGLDPGFHFLAVRTKGTDERWGIFESRGFYVTGAAADVADIIDAEYFFDSDPGIGNGISLSIPSGAVSNFTIDIPSEDLDPGFHFLAVRIKRADGSWGIFESRGFYISAAAQDAAEIVAAEFFFDGDDPGEGLATSLTINDPGNIVVQDFSIETTSLSPGDYILSMRVKDSNNLWSLVETDTFIILDCTAPDEPIVNDESRCDEGTLTLTASGASGTQEYRWFEDATTTVILFTGEVFETPELSESRFYYVSIFDTDTSCESERAEVSAAINALDQPVINPSGEISICQGSTVILSAPVGFTVYQWSTGEITRQILVNTAGNYTVQTGDGNCLSEPADSVIVVLIQDPPCSPPTPNAPPVISKEVVATQIEGRIEIDLTAFVSDPDNNIDFSSLRVINNETSRGIPAFIDPAFILIIDYSGNPFTGTDRVTLEVCDLAGACVQEVLDIEVVGEVIVFNAVTPNGDGINDFMLIKYLEVIPGAEQNKVFILNRWGDVVTEITNYNNVERIFTGQSNSGSELPAGTYFYKIEFSGNIKPITGFLNLIR